MRTYTLLSALVFALVLLAHVARVVLEGVHVLGSPFFTLSTAVCLGFALWAARLLLQARQAQNRHEA